MKKCGGVCVIIANFETHLVKLNMHLVGTKVKIFKEVITFLISSSKCSFSASNCMIFICTFLLGLVLTET